MNPRNDSRGYLVKMANKLNKGDLIFTVTGELVEVVDDPGTDMVLVHNNVNTYEIGKWSIQEVF